MQFLQTFAGLFANFGNLTWQMVVMWVIGGLLIYLAIAKKMEPSLLLPMGFGAILVNLPLSGAITQGTTVGPISALFDAGMSNELFPLLLFIGIGAMIDFGPLLEKPWLMLFGAAAQFGIFATFLLSLFLIPILLPQTAGEPGDAVCQRIAHKDGTYRGYDGYENCPSKNGNIKRIQKSCIVLESPAKNDLSVCRAGSKGNRHHDEHGDDKENSQPDHGRDEQIFSVSFHRSTLTSSFSYHQMPTWSLICQRWTSSKYW